MKDGVKGTVENAPSLHTDPILRVSVIECPVKCQTLEMKAHPAETFKEVRMFYVLKPVVEYIQQASQVRHAQHGTDNKHPLQVDSRSHTAVAE